MIPKDDTKLSRTIYIGTWSSIIGFVLILAGILLGTLTNNVFIMSFAGIGGLLFLLGLIMVGFSLFSGLKSEHLSKNSTEQITVSDVKVTARFAINSLGETLFSDLDVDFEDPKCRFFVRIQPNQGRQTELRTAPELWSTIGEGMSGDALVQGDWLCSFRPKIGAGQGTPYR